jgi:SAM-dependent methyltransferase
MWLEMSILGAVGDSLRYRGFLGTLRAGARIVAHPIRKREAFRIFEERRFDRKHGVDTAGTLHPRELDITPEEAVTSHRYEGVRPGEIREVISCLGITHQEFTFVDIGCGKGRALLIASDFPFKRIIGVELSTELTQVARGNVRRYHSRRQQCTDLQVVCTDATKYTLPPGPVVLYLYNPFEAPVMEAFLANVRRALDDEPRQVIAVYLNPTCDAVFANAPFLSNTRRRSSYSIYRSR